MRLKPTEPPRRPGGPGGIAEAAAAVLSRHAAGLVVLFAGVLLPLGLFASLAGTVHGAGTFGFDRPMLGFAQSLSGPGLDQFFLAVTAVGHEAGVIPMDIALVIVLAVFGQVRRSVFAAVALAGSGLLNTLTKQFFARDRPELWDSIAPEMTYSFPSGHAMGSMTLAAVLVLLTWPTRLRWPVLAFMAVFIPLVGFSRIYLGVHYPSDILAGWAAATAWAVGCHLLILGPARLRRDASPRD